jgi:transposase
LTNEELAIFLFLYVTGSIILMCIGALIYMVWMALFGEKNFSRKGVVESGVDKVEEDDYIIEVEDEEDDIIIEEF